jgi:hypothetical protein
VVTGGHGTKVIRRFAISRWLPSSQLESTGHAKPGFSTNAKKEKLRLDGPSEGLRAKSEGLTAYFEFDAIFFTMARTNLRSLSLRLAE